LYAKRSKRPTLRGYRETGGRARREACETKSTDSPFTGSAGRAIVGPVGRFGDSVVSPRTVSHFTARDSSGTNDSTLGVLACCERHVVPGSRDGRARGVHSMKQGSKKFGARPARRRR
jgi:hypothetical protein